jgi:hypothetical protein
VADAARFGRSGVDIDTSWNTSGEH